MTTLTILLILLPILSAAPTKKVKFIDTKVEKSGGSYCYSGYVILVETGEPLTKGFVYLLDPATHEQLAETPIGDNGYFAIFFDKPGLTLMAAPQHVQMSSRVADKSETKDAILKIQDNGIAVVGGFIFGSDTDTKDIFDKTVDFIHDTQIDAAQFTIQTPTPGTKLYQQLASEDRLLLKDYLFASQ